MEKIKIFKKLYYPAPVSLKGVTKFRDSDKIAQVIDN